MKRTLLVTRVLSTLMAIVLIYLSFVLVASSKENLSLFKAKVEMHDQLENCIGNSAMTAQNIITNNIWLEKEFKKKDSIINSLKIKHGL